MCSERHQNITKLTQLFSNKCTDVDLCNIINLVNNSHHQDYRVMNIKFVLLWTSLCEMFLSCSLTTSQKETVDRSRRKKPLSYKASRTCRGCYSSVQYLVFRQRSIPSVPTMRLYFPFRTLTYFTYYLIPISIAF